MTDDIKLVTQLYHVYATGKLRANRRTGLTQLRERLSMNIKSL